MASFRFATLRQRFMSCSSFHFTPYSLMVCPLCHSQPLILLHIYSIPSLLLPAITKNHASPLLQAVAILRPHSSGFPSATVSSTRRRLALLGQFPQPASLIAVPAQPKSSRLFNLLFSSHI